MPTPAVRRPPSGPTALSLPGGLTRVPQHCQPAWTAELHGPVALVDRLAAAQPMARQLVDQALAGRDLTKAESTVDAARVAAAIIAKAPPSTWPREITVVAANTGLDKGLLSMSVVDTIETDTDALGRLSARDRRDDLDRSQHVPPTAADIASLSTTRATPIIRPPQRQPVDTSRPPTAVAAATRGGIRR